MAVLETVPTFDARKRPQSPFERVRAAEYDYARRLRQVARAIDMIVKGYDHPLNDDQEADLQEALRRYASMLQPWAKAVSSRMIAEVSRRDETAWLRYTRGFSYELQRELRAAPVGMEVQRLLSEQVNLITSLPLQAAERVHKLTIRARGAGDTRAEGIAKEIMRTGYVTRSRAMLIARTETARTASSLTLVRAKSVGSESYIWRTVRDSDVRPLHRKLEGKVFRYDDPPVAGERGERAHPGMIYNCRCVMEPIIPDLKY